MPNYVQNRIHLDGKSELIQQMLEKIQNQEYGIGTVDFEKILPMPSNVGDAGVISWRIINWGTKWNAFDYDTDVDYSEEYSQSGVLKFWTAWSAPHPVLEKLAQMFPEIEFVHEWADEDLGRNCGRRVYVQGEEFESYSPETEKERMEFACSVWGETPESMGYAFVEEAGSYQYVGFSDQTETIDQNPA